MSISDTLDIILIVIITLCVKTLLFCKPLNYLLHGSDGCGVFKWTC